MRALLFLLLLLPGFVFAQETEPKEEPALAEEVKPPEESDISWLPDLAVLRERGWRDVAWTTHRSGYRAKKDGLKAQLWSRWPLDPRPGDRSLLVREDDGISTGLVFHEAMGLVRVELAIERPVEEVVAAVSMQLGDGVAATGGLPAEVLSQWVFHGVGVAAVDGGSVVVVEAPEEMKELVTLLPHEPWDLEGPVSREAATARLAIGIPMLATSFVAALVLLPLATQNPEASIAVAAPLGACIGVGSALTFSGGVKLRGALPRADLETWERAAAP